uniref:Uncharacterized protein n=1 Tax=Parascaris equorum TaxID=6256 RepID=A0A914RAF5_PAREQ
MGLHREILPSFVVEKCYVPRCDVRLMSIRCGVILESLHADIEAVAEGHVAACVVACCAGRFTWCDGNERRSVVLLHSAEQL